MDGGSEQQDAFGNQTITEGEWAGWQVWMGDPFEDQSGPFYFKYDEEGRCRCAFRAETKHMNGGGFMHGGCIMTFADSCIFSIARPAIMDVHCVTASFNGDFVGKARVGDLVECTGEVVKATRSMVFVRGMIFTGEDPIMSFSAIIKKTGPRDQPRA